MKKRLSADVLKIIAVICMTLDHTAILIYGAESSNFIYSLMRFFGRIAFPIFAFLIVEGHIHTRSEWKYTLRLGIFYLISFVPYNLFEGHSPFYFSFSESQNIFLTLLLCQVALMVFDWAKNDIKQNLLSYLFAAVFIIIPMKVPIFMYSWIGAALVFAVYLTKIYDSPRWLSYVLIALCFIPKYVYAFKSGDWLEWGVILAIPIIALYNGEKGKIIGKNIFGKYFFYSFYPLHLLILWAIGYFIK